MIREPQPTKGGGTPHEGATVVTAGGEALRRPSLSSRAPLGRRRGGRRDRRDAWLFVGPAVLLVAFYFVYPALQTIYLSFFDGSSAQFVGLQNYVHAFTSNTMLTAFRNNVVWLVAFTTGTVFLGLVAAILTDRVRYESVAKSIIFLPMAISFVGAGVIWKFVYAYNPPAVAQIGLLNGIITSFGGNPIPWLIERPWINNFALIFVGVWIWTGFCMVIISAAYKGIPREFLEAARVDGASEWQTLRHIIVPALKPTLAVVATTMVINVLKVFDIIYVMTNGNFGTEVIANRMVKEMFQFRNYGRAAAIATILFVAIVPFLLVNVRRFRREEGAR